VDIAAPDYETRVAIVRKKAEERGQTLSAGVAEAIARTTFANVRELQGSLNRLIAVQELEERMVTADEVPRLVGGVLEHHEAPRGDEFGRFLEEISGTVERLVSQPAADHYFGEAIMRFESEGYRTRRLENALLNPPADDLVEPAIRQFEKDVERLREIIGEIITLESTASELARLEILRDPDRVLDAEALLTEVRERNRPLPAPPSGVTFENLKLSEELLAVRAARAVAQTPGVRYNPLFVFGGEGSGKTALMIALGAELHAARPEMTIAYIEGHAFAAELIRALEWNRVEGWRARYRRAQVLMLDNVDALVGTELAQEELFHLFEALQRNGAQLVFAARKGPRELMGIEERLRSRLESGLVVELPAPAGTAAQEEQKDLVGNNSFDGVEATLQETIEEDDGIGLGDVPDHRIPASAFTGEDNPDTPDIDEWFQNREKLLWDWPVVEDWIIEGME
jgi:chromosomal replication initiation ATPase DnaA